MERSSHELLDHLLMHNKTIKSDWDKTSQPEAEMMERNQSQQRLYVINRSGSGEAQFVLLNKDRTEIESYCVRLENWRLTKNIANFGVAVINNVLYVIGGYDKINCRHIHRVVKYDPHEFTWTHCAPLLKARAKFGCCVLEGKIYVSGGERNDGRVSCSCEMYDPETDRWSDTGLMMAPRSNHCTIVSGKEIYCAGGDFGTRSHDNFWIYDNGNWEELDADYPQKLLRCLDRFAVCADNHKIYFIGGVSCRISAVTGESKFSTERGMFSYTPNISTITRPCSHSLQSDVISPWTSRYPNMARPRHSCAAHFLGRKIYVFGGVHLETGQDVRVCECFDTENNTWEDEFQFRKGDLSNVVTATLDVPRRHNEHKINYELRWVLW